jgi:glycosyltransferase involved in cell wall biosynthesis
MAGKPMKSKRLLIVLESGATFSNLKRGFAYARFFAEHPEWSVEYADRKPPVSSVARRAAGRVGRALAPASWERRQLAARDRAILDRARTCDVVYFLKTPAADLQRQIIALGGPRVAVDVNDALWLPLHRQHGFERLEDMLRAADGLICENAYVASRIRTYNARVHVVPDCTQLGVFDAHRDRVTRDPAIVRLGWIGSWGTAAFLYAIWEPLEELFGRHPHLELRVLGAHRDHLPHFERVRWSAQRAYDQETMVREALAMDIGLYPLFHVEDSLARGSGKAAIYMAAGAVAVCEDIGDNPRLIDDNVNGVLARGHQDWLAKLDWLVTHPEERRRIGHAGLETVRKQLSDRVCFEQLIDALNAVASDEGARR